LYVARDGAGVTGVAVCEIAGAVKANNIAAAIAQAVRLMKLLLG
jgi:hypothetical protein